MTRFKLDQHLHLAAEVGILRRRKVLAERAKTLVENGAFASLYDPNCAEGHPPTYLDVLLDERILGLLKAGKLSFSRLKMLYKISFLELFKTAPADWKVFMKDHQ